MDTGPSLLVKLPLAAVALSKNCTPPGMPLWLGSVVGLVTNTPWAALEFCVNDVTPPKPPGPAVPLLVKCAVPALAVSKKMVSPPSPLFGPASTVNVPEAAVEALWNSTQAPSAPIPWPPSTIKVPLSADALSLNNIELPVGRRNPGWRHTKKRRHTAERVIRDVAPGRRAVVEGQSAGVAAY